MDLSVTQDESPSVSLIPMLLRSRVHQGRLSVRVKAVKLISAINCTFKIYIVQTRAAIGTTTCYTNMA